MSLCKSRSFKSCASAIVKCTIQGECGDKGGGRLLVEVVM